MAVDCIALLSNAIRRHPHLKVEDHPVVEKVTSLLYTSDEIGLINDYFRMQIEAEAGATYLVGRYISLVTKLKEMLREHRAGKLLMLGERNDDGYKWTAKGKEEWLLATDAPYATQLEQIAKVDNLLNLLKGLKEIVFGRNDKLEQLSINYRRDTLIDTRHG